MTGLRAKWNFLFPFKIWCNPAGTFPNLYKPGDVNRIIRLTESIGIQSNLHFSFPWLSSIGFDYLELFDWVRFLFDWVRLIFDWVRLIFEWVRLIFDWVRLSIHFWFSTRLNSINIRLLFFIESVKCERPLIWFPQIAWF